MNETSAPAPPDGLRASGKRLWRSVVDDYEVEAHESLLLVQACRCADRLDELAKVIEAEGVMITDEKRGAIAHPAAVEHRMQSIVLSRMIASLRLPSGDEDERRPQRRSGARAPYRPRAFTVVSESS